MHRKHLLYAAALLAPLLSTLLLLLLPGSHATALAHNTYGMAAPTATPDANQILNVIGIILALFSFKVGILGVLVGIAHDMRNEFSETFLPVFRGSVNSTERGNRSAQKELEE